ncbi:MAG: BlaI/MecI/CopY family transcriptional regulator [Clostridia bacterium]|nr:BlaI/MecI/CopY family transcriptional regulator [Clostridia bacterium]
MDAAKDTAKIINSDTVELGEVQLRFAEIVWANAPLGSGELVKICREEFGWKKTTTYTVLHKLCEKGIFVNENGTVKTVIGRERFYSAKSNFFVEKTFGGSLPSFFTAFVSQKKLSADEVDEIKKLIDEYRKEI